MEKKQFEWRKLQITGKWVKKLIKKYLFHSLCSLDNRQQNEYSFSLQYETK